MRHPTEEMVREELRLISAHLGRNSEALVKELSQARRNWSVEVEMNSSGLCKRRRLERP